MEYQRLPASWHSLISQLRTLFTCISAITCNHINFVRIRPMVQRISSRKESVTEFLVTKSNQFIVMSQLYIHENLARIQRLVHKILCRRESVMPKPMPTGFPPKTICSPPLIVCIEVFWPNQPYGVMLSAVSLSNHTFFWAGLVLEAVNQFCAHSSVRN